MVGWDYLHKYFALFIEKPKHIMNESQGGNDSKVDWKWC